MNSDVRFYRDAYGGAYFARRIRKGCRRATWAWSTTGGLLPRVDFGLMPKGHFHEYADAAGMYFTRPGGRWVFCDPDHGTIWKHRAHGCNCEACMRAARREWRRLKAGQRPGGDMLQGTGLVRRHLYYLLTTGMSRMTIARVSGIAPSTVARIWNMEQTHCTERVAQAILGVTRDDMVANDKVEGWRVHKLVAALKAAGITNRQIGSVLRYKEPRGVYRLTAGKQSRYTRLTFERLALLCRALAAQGRLPATVLTEVGAI